MAQVTPVIDVSKSPLLWDDNTIYKWQTDW